MTLYEIDAEFQKCFDPETGEMLVTDKEFDEICESRSAKLENLALWIKNLTYEAEDIGEEISSLRCRKDVKENQIERLKKYLGDYLHGECFETPRVKCSWRSSTSVGIDDEERFINTADKMFLREKVEINKQAIKSMLKDGMQIPGAYLVDKLNLLIK